MNLTQNDRLKQVTFDTLIAERLTGENLNSPVECLSLAIRAWDSLPFLGGQRNS